MWEYEELTQHLWSRSVEEQFYLIWPPLCASALPRRRAEALVVGVLVRRGFAADGSLRFRLDTRGLGILLGCAVSLSVEGADRPRLAALLGRPGLRRALAALLAASLAWVSWLATRGRIGEVTVDRYVIPPLDLGFALLVAMLWRGPPDGLARALSWRPPRGPRDDILWPLPLPHGRATVDLEGPDPGDGGLAEAGQIPAAAGSLSRPHGGDGRSQLRPRRAPLPAFEGATTLGAAYRRYGVAPRRRPGVD